MAGFLEIWTIWAMFDKWSYQQFKKSFRVYLTYSQHLIDLPTPSDKKIELRKNSFLTDFWCFTENAIIACKVSSKEGYPQVKISENFFAPTRSPRVLIGFQWLIYEKVSIIRRLKGCKMIFLISIYLTTLCYSECSKCISSQNP